MGSRSHGGVLSNDGTADRALPIPVPRYGSGKWKRARHLATREEIAARHAAGEWQITGPPEIRSDEPVRMFSLDQKSNTGFPLLQIVDVSPEVEPVVTDAERLLLCLFLRRYVTWCARSRRFAAMDGAARLHREISAQATMSASSR
jgi:hypothetical protein